MNLKFLSMNRGERIGALLLLCLMILVGVINIFLKRNDKDIDAHTIERAKEIATFRGEINATKDSVMSPAKVRSKPAKPKNERNRLNDKLPMIEEQ